MSDEKKLSIPLAERIRMYTLAAKAHGKQYVRISDVKIITEGIPSEITDEYVVFPAGSHDVVDTGDITGPAKTIEKIKYSCLITMNSIVRVELSDRGSN
jgi:hypothetical protein